MRLSFVLCVLLFCGLTAGSTDVFQEIGKAALTGNDHLRGIPKDSKEEIVKDVDPHEEAPVNQTTTPRTSETNTTVSENDDKTVAQTSARTSETKPAVSENDDKTVAQTSARINETKPVGAPKKVGMDFGPSIDRPLNDLLSGNKKNILQDVISVIKKKVPQIVRHSKFGKIIHTVTSHLSKSLSRIKKKVEDLAKALHIPLKSASLGAVATSPLLVGAISALLHHHKAKKAAQRAARKLHGFTAAQKKRLSTELQLLLQDQSFQLRSELRRIFQSLRLHVSPAELHGLVALAAQEEAIRHDDSTLDRATRLYLSRTLPERLWLHISDHLKDTLVQAINSEVRNFGIKFDKGLKDALKHAKVALTPDNAEKMRKQLQTSTKETATLVQHYLEEQNRLVADRIEAAAGKALNLKTPQAKRQFRTFVQQLMMETSDRVWSEMLPDAYNAFREHGLSAATRTKVADAFLKALTHYLAIVAPKLRLAKLDIELQVEIPAAYAKPRTQAIGAAVREIVMRQTRLRRIDVLRVLVTGARTYVHLRLSFPVKDKKSEKRRVHEYLKYLRTGIANYQLSVNLGDKRFPLAPEVLLESDAEAFKNVAGAAHGWPKTRIAAVSGGAVALTLIAVAAVVTIAGRWRRRNGLTVESSNGPQYERLSEA